MAAAAATSSDGAVVASSGAPDFNRPVTLQVGEEATKASPHKSVMEMETFFKRYFGEQPVAPHGPKFKPDPKAFYQHTLIIKAPDNKSKAKAKAKSRVKV
mmetsp:Transcript_19186/g.41266  ORF Transcript_19186/g.41266 Transcript_19186/m.41266 type:complete len:100 (-) Transcript_19186:266-565(-)